MDLNLVLGSVTTDQIIQRWQDINYSISITYLSEDYVIDRTYWTLLKNIEWYINTVPGSGVTVVDIYNSDHEVVTLSKANFSTFLVNVQAAFDAKSYTTSVTLSAYLNDPTVVKKADLEAWV